MPFRHALSSARDDRGQVLLLTAFSMVALLGMAALALDASHAYDTRNKLAMSADAAAKSAAVEIWRGNPGNYAAFAQAIIDQDKAVGRIPGNATPTIRLCSDAGATCLPAYRLNTYVEVILRANQQTSLGGILNMTSLNPTARAVAGASSGENCIMTLTGSMTQSNPVGSVTTEDCSVAIADNFDVRGTLEADSITAGRCSNGCDDVTIGPPPTDPLRNLPTPTAADCNSGTPGTNIDVGAATTLSHGTYHDIRFGDNHGWLTLNAGVYCITGTLYASSPGKDINIDATSGVLIYIAPTGTFQADSNNIDLRFTAQTTGSWAGVSFFQDRANTHDVTFGKNNGNVDTNGAIYVPSARVLAKNANFASSELCGILVAASIDWEKPNMTVTNTCGSFSGSPIKTISLAE